MIDDPHDTQSFIDESVMAPKGKPIEWVDSPFSNPTARGITVEEIEYDEYLIALEEYRLKQTKDNNEH